VIDGEINRVESEFRLHMSTPSLAPSAAPPLKLASRVLFDAAATERPYVLDVALVGDSSVAFSASDNSIRLFDKHTLQPVRTLSKGDASVTSICSIGGSSTLAATATDGSVSFWDSRQVAKPAMTLRGPFCTSSV
jgi:WD40 repeat protein